MDVTSWFEVEEPEEYDEESWDFSEAERAFLDALRSRAAAWWVTPAPGQAGRPEGESSLLVHGCLVDEPRPLALGEWAVQFHGTHVQAGKVRDQLFTLHESPVRGFFPASGTVEELAERCADWFENLLSRPVIRAEWPLEGGTHVIRWEFTDTGEVLATSDERCHPRRRLTSVPPSPGSSLNRRPGRPCTHTPMKRTVSARSARPVRSRGTPSFSTPTATPQNSTSRSPASVI